MDGLSPVFPIKDLNEHPGPYGISLRAYVATAMMPLAFDYWTRLFYVENPFEERSTTAQDHGLMAETAVEMADALIAELAK